MFPVHYAGPATASSPTHLPAAIIESSFTAITPNEGVVFFYESHTEGAVHMIDIEQTKTIDDLLTS